MEDESNSNEPSTSTQEAPASFKHTFEGSGAASVEADSGSQHPTNFQSHPQDKSILDLIDKYHTRRATQWALFSWNTWRLQKSRDDTNQPAIPLFFEMCGNPVEVLDKTMAKFVTDCKNKDNEDYTPETLRGILFGLQRFLKAYCTRMDKKPMAFIKNEYQFPKYCEALKKKIDDLNEGGITRKNAQAVGITPQQEEYLWDMGIFGCNSAEVLSNTVFFYVVKIFGIVSSNALRTMKSDAFVFGENNTGKYVELDTNFASELDIYDQTSCCHNLALLAPNTATKLRHYCNESNPRTFYNILKYYVEMIKLVDAEENCLFLKAKKEMIFSNQAIGRLQLQRKFCKMMSSANLQGYFTTQALVQSCLDNLQVKGYMVRRKQTFLPQQQLEISKLLDPPPGIIKTLDVRTQTKAVLQLVNAGQRIPVQSLLDQSHLQYVIQLNQTPQPSVPPNVTQKKHQERMDLQTALQASQNILSAGLHPSSKAAYISTVSNLTNQLTAANKNLPQKVVTFGTVPMSTGTENKDDSAHSEETYPVYLSKVENDGTERSVNESGNETDGTSDYEYDNIIIKQEPADYEGEYFQTSETKRFQTSESPNISQSELARKRKPNNVDQTYDTSPRKTAKSDNIHVKSETHQSDDEFKRKMNKSHDKEKVCMESEPRAEESVMCSAEIEYSFNNDLTRKITKQEISLKEDGQSVFNFCGANKMGRQMSDLDINLGDYLPENCTIKPGDIDIKRVILPEGGKMVIKLKYSIDK